MLTHDNTNKECKAPDANFPCQKKMRHLTSYPNAASPIFVSPVLYSRLSVYKASIAATATIPAKMLPFRTFSCPTSLSAPLELDPDPELEPEAPLPWENPLPPPLPEPDEPLDPLEPLPELDEPVAEDAGAELEESCSGWPLVPGPAPLRPGMTATSLEEADAEAPEEAAWG